MPFKVYNNDFQGVPQGLFRTHWAASSSTCVATSNGAIDKISSMNSRAVNVLGKLPLNLPFSFRSILKQSSSSVEIMGSPKIGTREQIDQRAAHFFKNKSLYQIAESERSAFPLRFWCLELLRH